MGGFQDSFTKEQKAAIIGTLAVIAHSDGSVHQKEMQQIDQTCKLLGIEPDDPIFASVARQGPNYSINILNSLDRSQKEWYVLAVHQMVRADGKVENVEISYSLGFCEKIGISEDDYIQIIQKAEMLLKKFM